MEINPLGCWLAHVGIIGHNKVLVSLAALHFINSVIRNGDKLSINIVDEEILPQADYAGSVSGAKADKSELFDYEVGDSGTPIIKKAPLQWSAVLLMSTTHRVLRALSVRLIIPMLRKSI